MKNLKAAAIAWELVMEHNQVYRALTSVVHTGDDQDYNTEKNRAFKFVYGIVMRVMESETDIPDGMKEFLSKTLAEKLPEEWVRKVINPHRKPATPGP
jgi:hypothetical protein